MRRGNWTPFFAVIPSMALILTIVIYPLIYAFYLSLTNRILINPVFRFVGLKNYLRRGHKSEAPR